MEEKAKMKSKTKKEIPDDDLLKQKLMVHENSMGNPKEPPAAPGYIVTFFGRLGSFLGAFVFCRRRGTHLVLSYFLLKFMMLGNAVGQLYLMQRFLGLPQNQTLYGISVVQNLLNGHDWRATMVFPRVAYCTTRLRQLGVVHNTVTSQCVLPVNMLNEKIYIFLWWWISFDAALVVLSTLSWFNRLVFDSSSMDFVRNVLFLREDVIRLELEMVKRFSIGFLRKDGVFLLRMISQNVGELTASEVIGEMWHSYKLRVTKGDCQDNYQTDAPGGGGSGGVNSGGGGGNGVGSFKCDGGRGGEMSSGADCLPLAKSVNLERSDNCAATYTTLTGPPSRTRTQPTAPSEVASSVTVTTVGAAIPTNNPLSTLGFNVRPQTTNATLAKTAGCHEAPKSSDRSSTKRAVHPKKPTGSALPADSRQPPAYGKVSLSSNAPSFSTENAISGRQSHRPTNQDQMEKAVPRVTLT